MVLCKPVVDDSNNLDEEQDPDPHSSGSEIPCKQKRKKERAVANL